MKRSTKVAEEHGAQGEPATGLPPLAQGLPHETPSAALVERPILSLAEKRDEALQDVTDRLLSESQGILADSLATFDLDQDDLDKPKPPKEWVDEFGSKRAHRRLRVARAASLPKKDAPIALEQARAIMVGVVSAKAREKGGNKTLNVAFVNVPAPPEYAKVILDMKK